MGGRARDERSSRWGDDPHWSDERSRSPTRDSPDRSSPRDRRSRSPCERRDRDRHERYDRHDRSDRHDRHERRRGRSPQEPRSPGDWVCQCGSYNFKRRQVCYRRACAARRGQPSRRLLLRRLDALSTEERVLDSLKERCDRALLDSLTAITVAREPQTGVSRCIAYLDFESATEAADAQAQISGLRPQLRIDGREVQVSLYVERAPDPPAITPQVTPVSRALSEADRVNAAAAVAQSAISAAHARQLAWPPPAPAGGAPVGDGKTKYEAPDVRTFLYDETSGYYYDPATSLYYDGTTQYFYNNALNRYMYWDAATLTYVAVVAARTTAEPAAQATTVAAPAEATPKEPEEKKKREKEDKVKVAKKIAKDMERWARTLNQKKENARSNIVAEQPTDSGTSAGAADIGFSVLGAGPVLQHVRELSPPLPIDSGPINPQALDTEGDEGVIDWAKLTCLACKRRFPSVDVLMKHKTMSELHRQKLIELGQESPVAPIGGYRDRAAERRLKFGEDEPPPVRRRYEPPSAPIAPPPSVADGVGGRMLQRMGWSQGRGLGKSEQGRVAPVEADGRAGLAGLGQKRGIYTPTPGETYRDTVKKLMIARYKEVVGQEDGS